MRRPLLIKTIVTGLLAVLLLLPLNAVVGMVGERQTASQSVLVDIQQTGVGDQTLTGPILIVPYRRTTRTEVIDPKNGKKTYDTRTDEGRLHFLPDHLSITARVGTERRYRGIYAALLYDAQHALTGAFSLPEGFGLARTPEVSYVFGSAFVILGVADTRGIKGTPTLAWEGQAREQAWASGAEGILPRGVHADVGRVKPGRSVGFEIGLTLEGTQALSYVPVGKQTTVAVKSEWPHPSFVGQLLPESRTIGAGGFDAVWRTSHLASNIVAALDDCLGGKCETGLTTFGVAFIEPVNVYLQTARAAKYGFLFVALTFLVFQLFELFKKLAIHPVQYGLVGIALAMFFLLLLALTEHVPFAIAYLVASASCVGLLGFYVSYVLRSALRALGFGVLLSTLYGAMYLLLRSEDFALLLGAALLFAILFAVMFVTRQVDWYRISVPVAVADATRPGQSGSQ